MDKYISEKTIIKNQTFETLKDMILCSKCQKLLIKSFMCSICQNNFCKKCIDKKKHKKVKCPIGCENSIINELTEKKNFLTKCKFKCINGCGEEIDFEDVNNHYKSKCLKKNQKKIFGIFSKKKIAETINQKNEEMRYMTSKLFIVFLYIY